MANSTANHDTLMETPQEQPISSMIANRLFKVRTVIISGEINQDLAGRVVAQLTALAAESDRPITIFINSQGGHVESGDTIHDVIRFIKPRVLMIGTGWVASAGALIFVSVPVEDRYCLPNTRFLLHQPAGGVRGSSSDIAIESEQILQMRERINRIIARQTGQSLEKITSDTTRNFWLSAAQAIEYGIVGRVIERVDEVERVSE